MRAVRFVSLVIPWTVVLWILAVLLHSDPSHALATQWEQMDSFMEDLWGLFLFSDHWNVIALTFLTALSVIVLSINDLLIGRIIIKMAGHGAPAFWMGGMLWLVKSGCNIGLFLLQLMFICYGISFSYSSSRMVHPYEITSGKYRVLLLGTSKFLKGTRQVNSYYAERIQSCVLLYQKGVIDELIISGDSSSGSYDEVAMMYNDLRQAGVRRITIHLDKKGMRTFDSIRRMKSRWPLKRGMELLIVSQSFHLQRALYLAMMEGIPARGVVAKGSLTKKMFEREMLAKTKVLLDVYVFNTQMQGLPSRPRRLIHLSSYADASVVCFVLAMVAIAGRLTRELLDY